MAGAFPPHGPSYVRAIRYVPITTGFIYSVGSELPGDPAWPYNNRFPLHIPRPDLKQTTRQGRQRRACASLPMKVFIAHFVRSGGGGSTHSTLIIHTVGIPSNKYLNERTPLAVPPCGTPARPWAEHATRGSARLLLQYSSVLLLFRNIQRTFVWSMESGMFSVLWLSVPASVVFVVVVVVEGKKKVRLKKGWNAMRWEGEEEWRNKCSRLRKSRIV